MRNVRSEGIQVSPTSTPDIASSRRHFMSATMLVGGVLTALIVAPRQALAQGNGKGKGGGGGGAHCFLKGTRILTSEGERPIENLQIGASVLTVSGEARPIKWIGRVRFDRDERAPWDEAVLPVKIARGAFNGDLPVSDLYVSDRHRFLINGLLISAGNLINGSTITRLKSTNSDALEYLHIRLESHDIILANGAPAETLQGKPSRIEFDNFDEYVAMYGAELPPQTPYAPEARDGRRQLLWSHLRGMLAPICDRRQPLEIIQDELSRRAQRRSAA